MRRRRRASRGTLAADRPVGDVVPADRWRAVLIAGDNSSPAFDNGVDALRDKLAATGVRDITRSDFRSPARAGCRLATAAQCVEARCAAGGGEACLVFITSHGDESGFFLRPDRGLRQPAALDRR